MTWGQRVTWEFQEEQKARGWKPGDREQLDAWATALVKGASRFWVVWLLSSRAAQGGPGTLSQAARDQSYRTDATLAWLLRAGELFFEV